MADITPVAPKDSGTTIPYQSAVTGGDTLKGNDGRVLLLVNNGHSADITVTIETAATVKGLAIDDRNVVVANSTDPVVIGPFLPDIYNDNDGDIGITYSAVTSLEVAAIRHN